MLAVSIFATLLLSASATAGPIKRSPRLHRFGSFQMGSDPWGSVVVSYDPSADVSAVPTTSVDTSISAAATTSVATTIRSTSTAAATTTSLSSPTTTSAEPATTSSDEDRSSAPAPVHQDFQGNGNWNGNNDWNFSTAYTFSTSFSSPTAVSQDAPSASEMTILSTSTQTSSTLGTSSSSPTASSSSSSSSAPAPSQSSNSGATAQGDIDAYLKVHNTARSAHKANDLQWNNTLADAAFSWVGNCNFEHSGGSLGPYGENLAEGTNLDASAAVQMWVDEGNSFNANSPEAYASLHFTQVVWAATTQVGCAYKSCGDMVMHVCEYYPQGNVLGTFGDNVF